MRRGNLALVGALTIALGSCGRSESYREAERKRVEADRNSAAFKAGRAAHKIAKGAGKVAGAVGRKVGESARKAREGWKDEAQNSAGERR